MVCILKLEMFWADLFPQLCVSLGELASSDIPYCKFKPFGNKRFCPDHEQRNLFVVSSKNIMIFLLMYQLQRIMDVISVLERDIDFIGLAFICSSSFFQYLTFQES